MEALSEIEIAIDVGVQSPGPGGHPHLLAANDPKCKYIWGAAEGYLLFGEALLLKVAQSIGKNEIVGPADAFSAEINKDLVQARKSLERAEQIWRSLRNPNGTDDIHPDGKNACAILKDLANGILTHYPLHPIDMVVRCDDSRPDHESSCGTGEVMSQQKERKLEFVVPSQINPPVQATYAQVFTNCTFLSESTNLQFGDRYTAGQAGSMGPNISTAKLAEELAKLKNELSKRVLTSEEKMAIDNIDAAEKAAQEGDGSAALRFLKAAGKWAFEAATEIGTEVAAAAIKSSLGLPPA